MAGTNLVRGRGRWVVAVAVVSASAGSCSILNRIDACNTSRSPDFQVNQLPADDQYVSPGQAAVRLSTGQIAVVWNSDRARTASNQSIVPPNPGTVRAALRTADGQFVTACRDARVGEVAVSADPSSQATGHPVVATGTARNSPVYVAWRQGPLGQATRVVVRALDYQLCELCSQGRSEFVVSEDRDAVGDDQYGAFRPTLAVSADGTRALVAYLVRRPTSVGFSIKYRPVTVSAETSACGQLGPNPLDGSDAPGLIADAGRVGAPVLATLRDGFVLVWPDASEGRWVARWRFMDRLGVNPADRPGTPAPPRATELGGVADLNAPPHLSLAVDGDQLVLGWDRVREPAPRLREVVFQRFDADLRAVVGPVAVSPPTGDHDTPAVVALSNGGVMVAWDDDTAGAAASEVLGRVFDRAGAAMFTSVACDRVPFRLSTITADRRLAGNLVRAEDRVVALYSDASGTPPDTFGHAVRGRSFVITDLAPGLR